MYRSDKSYQYLAPLIDTKMLRHQKLAVVTYPNYYGECFDINQCVKQFHDYNIPVLIDEAHGAHFNLKHFPKSALESKLTMLFNRITKLCLHLLWDQYYLFIKMHL